MAKRKRELLSIKDIKIGIEIDDLHYFFTQKCSPDDIEDETLREMAEKLIEVTNNMQDYLDQFDDLDDDDYSTESEDDDE